MTYIPRKLRVVHRNDRAANQIPSAGGENGGTLDGRRATVGTTSLAIADGLVDGRCVVRDTAALGSVVFDVAKHFVAIVASPAEWEPGRYRQHS